MAKIKYIEFNGTEHEADVANGLSVMEGAIQNDIPGIDASMPGISFCIAPSITLRPLATSASCSVPLNSIYLILAILNK